MDKLTAYHCVRLSELPHVGAKGLIRLLVINRSLGRSLDEFFQLPEAVYRDEYRLPAPAIECLVRRRALYEDHCSRLADRFLEHGGIALLLGGPGYPRSWEHYLGAPPAVVFALGDTALLEL